MLFTCRRVVVVVVVVGFFSRSWCRPYSSLLFAVHAFLVVSTFLFFFFVLFIVLFIQHFTWIIYHVHFNSMRTTNFFTYLLQSGTCIVWHNPHRILFHFFYIFFAVSFTWSSSSFAIFLILLAISSSRSNLQITYTSHRQMENRKKKKSKKHVDIIQWTLCVNNNHPCRQNASSHRLSHMPMSQHDRANWMHWEK